jgi:thioredoxin-related protein
MKLLSLIIPFVFLSSTDWLTDFEKAKEAARENHRYILLNFSGSDWCGPCIKMKKEIFEAQPFQDFANSNLVLVRADFPRHKKNQLEAKQKEHNEKLAERFNPRGKFPLTILLDSNGKVIDEWDGYPNMTVEEFVDEIRSRTHGN